jgi:uncharacterized membrane protein YkvA (DUF1232 family)
VTAPEPPAQRDPFPTDRFTALIRHMPPYGRLAWRLGRDPRVPASRRAILLGGAAYLVSPIDLVPGIIPVAGQLDDAVAVLVALRLALNGLAPEERVRLLADVGLEPGVLDEDLRTIGALTAWLGRTGARWAWRGTKAAGRGTVAVARGSKRLGTNLARRYLRPITAPDEGP